MLLSAVACTTSLPSAMASINPVLGFIFMHGLSHSSFSQIILRSLASSGVIVTGMVYVSPTLNCNVCSLSVNASTLTVELTQKDLRTEGVSTECIITSVLPFPIAVTKPLSETVHTEGSKTVKVTPLLEASSGSTLHVNCSVSPLNSAIKPVNISISCTAMITSFVIFLSS